jgi:hypothetical protein
MTDGNWDNLAQKFKADANSAELGEERKVQEQRLVDNNGPELWKQFKEAIDAGVSKINAQTNALKYQIFPAKGDEESIQVSYNRQDGSKLPRQISAVYSNKTHTLRISGWQGASHDYKVVPNGVEVGFSAEYSHSVRPVDEIAQEMLAALLQK